MLIEADDFFLEFIQQVFPDGRGFLVVLQAFCDETGNHGDARIACVGGYLFSPSNATLFQTRYREMLTPLRSKGVDHFHATDCATPDGQFKNLSEAERMALFGDMIDLIQRTAEIGFVAEVDRKLYRQWKELNPSIQMLAGSEFCVGSLQCLWFFSDWVKEHDPQSAIVYEFESGDKEQMDEIGAIMNTIQSSQDLSECFKFEKYSFGKKKLVPHLNAADLLLWAYQKSNVNHKLYPDYVRISRNLFRGKVSHKVVSVGGTLLTFRAVWNQSHGLRQK
jgi:hypothetical protein